MKLIFALFTLFFVSFSAFAYDRPMLSREHMITSHPNDPDCSKAFQLAEKTVHDNPSRFREESFRLVGLFFVRENVCQVYDIMPLQTLELIRLSPQEVLEAIFEYMKKVDELDSYETVQDGKVFLLYEKGLEIKT